MTNPTDIGLSGVTPSQEHQRQVARARLYSNSLTAILECEPTDALSSWRDLANTCATQAQSETEELAWLAIAGSLKRLSDRFAKPIS